MTGSTFDLSGVHDEHALKASVPPPLAELCVTAIAANFVNRPTLRGIPARYIDRVTELLPAQMALEVTGPLIDDEGYWKRSALARWDNCQISSHGSSWKRLYFERNLEDFLEAFDPLKQDTEELTRLLAVSKDYIFSLHLKQFLSHLDLEMYTREAKSWTKLKAWLKAASATSSSGKRDKQSAMTGPVVAIRFSRLRPYRAASCVRVKFF